MEIIKAAKKAMQKFWKQKVLEKSHLHHIINQRVYVSTTKTLSS